MAERRNPFLPPSDDEGQEPKHNYDPEPIYIENDEDDFHISLDDGYTKADLGVDHDKHWYVVHCYSGYENKVRHAIEQRIETMGMQDRIFEVLIPTEEEVEVKDGKRRTVVKRVFPGYILVQLRLDEDSWYVVRNTPGVTGFVGNGNEPTPLTKDEVNKIIHRMEAEEKKVTVDFKVGEKVRISGGPFNEFVGKVAAIDTDKQKVRVMVDFFGRETPVELDFLEVEKV
jgi:transcription termination/antitermination protein NusG